MKTLTQHEIALLPGSGFTTTLTCCEWNIFGISKTMDVFSYNVNWAGAVGQHYGENRMSACNRL